MQVHRAVAKGGQPRRSTGRQPRYRAAVAGEFLSVRRQCEEEGDMPKIRGFQMPTALTITGRTSSITNAFALAIIPIEVPTEAEVRDALSVLGMTQESVCCAYCGGPHTEWDHLRPVIREKKPTGYISEIANLVPACGKCNQSKGSREWRDWIEGPARHSPRTRGVSDLSEKIARLSAYEEWRQPRCLDLAALAGDHLWQQHWANYQAVIEVMRESQEHAAQIRRLIAQRAGA